MFEAKTLHLALKGVESKLLEVKLIGRLSRCRQKLTPKIFEATRTAACGLRPEDIIQLRFSSAWRITTGKKTGNSQKFVANTV